MGCLTGCGPLAYDIETEFGSDNAKNSACFERRGFDFAYAVRVISARKANPKEVVDYEYNARQD